MNQKNKTLKLLFLKNSKDQTLLCTRQSAEIFSEDLLWCFVSVLREYYKSQEIFLKGNFHLSFKEASYSIQKDLMWEDAPKLQSSPHPIFFDFPNVLEGLCLVKRELLISG